MNVETRLPSSAARDAGKAYDPTAPGAEPLAGLHLDLESILRLRRRQMLAGFGLQF